MTLAHDDLPGAEPALVLIHGWSCTRWTMNPVAQAFPGHRRLVIDLPGHGQSADQADLSIAAQARAVLATMPPRAILVGHSMGAQIVVEAAVQAPDRVMGAVLLDPAPLVSYPKAIESFQGLNAHVQKADMPTFLEGFARKQVVRFSDPAIVDQMAQVMAATDPQVARRAFQAMIDFDGSARMAAMSCPTLMIVIDKALNRPADVIRVNPKVMTGQLVGAGHMVQFEAMDQVAAMMRRWLDLKGFAI